MKRINLIFGLLCIFNFSNSYAEDGDRLSNLSKILSEGSYTHPANSESTTLREKLEDKQRKTEFEDVPRSELKKLGMLPAYGDSIIRKDTEKNEYFEIKEFPDGNYMYRTLSQKEIVAVFPVAGEDDPFGDGWKVVCYIDQITAIRNCSITKYAIMILKSAKHGLVFSVSNEPNKLNPLIDHYVRIDKNTPLKTTSIFIGSQAANIIEQMKRGEIMRTRFHEFGDTYEETIYLDGFTNAYNFMNLMYPQVK